MSSIPKGIPPKPVDQAKRDYVLKKLEEVRKDCQWLLGLGAAGILGVVIKDGFGAGMPDIRFITLVVSITQILVSMLGAMSTWRKEDSADVESVLMTTMRHRYIIRNTSIVLLAGSFILISILGFLTPTKP